MNNMPSKKSIISLAIGSAVAATLGTVSVASAAENPFAAQSLELAAGCCGERHMSFRCAEEVKRRPVLHAPTAAVKL